MKHRKIKEWLFDAMPRGEWVTIEWVEAAIKEQFKNGYTAPAALLSMLFKENAIQRRKITRRNNRLIAEYMRALS